MTLTAHPITVNRRTNEAVTVTVPIYSTEPGVVTAAAAGCTFPDGADVTIAGTREYRLDGRGGDYLAVEGVGQGRLSTTIFIKVDWSRISSCNTTAANTFEACPILSSIRTDTTRRINWAIMGAKFATGARLQYVQSANSTSNEAAALVATIEAVSNDIRKYAIMIMGGGAGDVDVYVYRGARANKDTLTRATTSGTMGGTEALILQTGMETAKIARIATNDELDAWFADDTVPATNREFYYAGGHEIVPGAAVIWDSAGTNDLRDTLTVTSWQAPSMTVRNVDDHLNPVVPASSIRVTIPAAVSSPVTLTLTRPRAGVPARATDGEKTESTTGTITLVNTPTTVLVGPAQTIVSRS